MIFMNEVTRGLSFSPVSLIVRPIIFGASGLIYRGLEAMVKKWCDGRTDSPEPPLYMFRFVKQINFMSVILKYSSLISKHQPLVTAASEGKVCTFFKRKTFFD